MELYDSVGFVCDMYGHFPLSSLLHNSLPYFFPFIFFIGFAV